MASGICNSLLAGFIDTKYPYSYPDFNNFFVVRFTTNYELQSRIWDKNICTINNLSNKSSLPKLYPKFISRTINLKETNMKRIRPIGIFLLVLALPMLVFAQATISGKVTDAKTGNPLAGANVLVVGTSLGAAADANGNYTIMTVPSGAQTITVSVIGYEQTTQNVTVPAQGGMTLNFTLTTSALQLSAVTVTGNFARDRETPVAFTTIGEEHIKNNFTVQDVPHLFANTPGVYVTTDGGSGMGDSKVLIRGFDEQRIAVMINNVPVNDPESKKVYWSNWGSLPAASQSIQIQRGVGSSLYGSGALGGSINVVTKDAPADKSLGFSFTGGQYGILKGGVDYNSGLMGGNKSLIARFNYLEGNGWRKNTFYRGIQYYLSAMLFPNERNTIKVILHGAPQYHAYGYYGMNPAFFADKEDFDPDGKLYEFGFTDESHGSALELGKGPRQNKYYDLAYGFGYDASAHPYFASDSIDLGQLNEKSTKLMDVLFNKTPIDGDIVGGLVEGNGLYSLDNNVYHKPQFEVHHSIKLSENSKLTSTFFVSNGYGYGENVDYYFAVPRNDDGTMIFDKMVDGDFYAGNVPSVIHYRAYSDHFQTGLLSSYETVISGHDITAGVETRWWKARHAGKILNTFSNAATGDYEIGSIQQDFEDGDLYYDYTTTKPQITMFGHSLLKFGKLNVMIDGQFATLNYHLLEDIPSNLTYPTHLADESHGGDIWTGSATYDHDSDTLTAQVPVEYELWDFEKNYNYFSPKFGVNYNINEALNVFANYSQAVNEPRVKFFFNYGSPNEALELESTKDIELGFGYRAELMGMPIDAKYNFYNIDFDGKALRIMDPSKTNQPGYDYKGRRYIPIGGAFYRGHEISANFKPIAGLTLGFNLSMSTNAWKNPNNSEGAQYLYSIDDVVAGTHYTDAANGTFDYGELSVDIDGDGKYDAWQGDIWVDGMANGHWDAGEPMVNGADYVDDFGDKIEPGMPQFILGMTANYNIGGLSVGAAYRYYQDNYVFADNREFYVGPGKDDLWGNADDEKTTVLPAAGVIDFRAAYLLDIMSGLNISLNISNILDTKYWQSGSEYGTAPGAARTVMLNLGVNL